MFRFLKGLMKGNEPPAALGIRDIPAWIDGEEERVKDGLAERVRDCRTVLLEARCQIEEVLSGFDTDSMEEVPHPKLAGVTERSLPLFLKAMRTSLSRALPDDPEGFYTAAGEILKGCLSALRGQGRYLASRFPDEMKVLREGVDTMGREVNTLTPEISRARERLRGLADLRESVAHYSDVKKRAAFSQEEINSLEKEVRTSGASLEHVNRALADLEKGEDYLVCQGELTRIRSLEGDRNEATRLYRAAAATGAHLFRKGEKVASRKKDREAMRILRDAVALLEKDLPLDEAAAGGILPPAQKVIAAMVASGDLPLKNKEETDLLQVPGRLLQGIIDTSRRFQGISGEISSGEAAVLSHPAIAKSRNLKGEREKLEKRITLARDRLELVRREAADLGRQVKVSLDEVRQRVDGLSRKPVQVKDSDSG
jgi:predicted  nucleic acid-binding Zn-ribbon protein